MHTHLPFDPDALSCLEIHPKDTVAKMQHAACTKLLISAKSVIAGVERRPKRWPYRPPVAECPTAETGGRCWCADTDNLYDPFWVCRAGFCVRNEGNTNVFGQISKRNNRGEKPKAHKKLPAGEGIGSGRQCWKLDILEGALIILTVKQHRCFDITRKTTSCHATESCLW